MRDKIRVTVLENTDVLIWWAHMANHSEILIQAAVTPNHFHQVETALKYRNITQGEKQ